MITQRHSSIFISIIAVFFFVIFSHSSVVHASDNGLTRFTTSHGLDVIVKEDHARKVATIQFWVLVGSADENDDQRGISHLIEHMAFKGTERRGVGEIAAEVEALGGRTNAYTSWDRTVFFVTVPSRAVEQGLDILTDAVIRPKIDPDELEKEKKVVLEEILEGEERPSRKAFKLLAETAYTRSPYRYPVIGYPETVKSFTREDILEFRKRWYVPENSFLLIVGDVDAEALRPAIERMTKDFVSTGVFRPSRPVEPPQKKVRSAVKRDRNARETRLHMAFHIPSLRGADVNALDLVADILGARESSRLVSKLQKKERLVHSISAFSMTPKEPGLFIVSARLDAKNVEQVTRRVLEEIRASANEPPTEDELKLAKTNIESSHVYSRETVGGIARSLGAFEADMGDAAFESSYLRANRAVTAEEVSAAAKRYLTTPNVTVTVLVPEKAEADVSEEKLVSIAESFTPSETSVAEKESGPETITKKMSNGLRVVLVPDSSNSLVSIRLASLGGKRFETSETAGIMNFTARMLNKGTASKSEEEIARTVEAMGGRIQGFSGYDSFGMTTSLFSRQLDDGLALLAELYTAPSFPMDKMDRERALIINEIKTAPDRPAPFTIQKLNETLFVEHPYGLPKEGRVETVSAFTRDHLVEVYERFAVPENTVITLVGKFDPDAALERIEKLFGAVKPRGLQAPAVAKEAPPTSVREKAVRLPRAKAHLALGFQAGALQDEDRYPLEVLNNILAGQGGRLFRELRDKESLAYMVTSFFRPALDRGVFGFYMACDESKTSQALDGLFREIKRIREAKVSPEELESAKNNVIGNHRISMQSSSARAANIGLNTLYDLGFDYDEEYVRNLSKVTADQVLDVARKYLDPETAAVVKILPDTAEKAPGGKKG